MAEERPITPPLRKPVDLHLNPVHTNSMFVEMLNRDDPAYTANSPVKRGTLYSTIVGAKQEIIDQFPLLYFVQETQYQQSDQLVLWRWVTDPTAQDTYNAEITYALESVTSPTYARTYTIRRDAYDNLTPIAQGTPLRGLIGVKIVDGGQDYTYATGTIDTDATVEFVIDPSGVIISGIVTNEGLDVISGGQITITGDGALAEATAIIQPASAVLIGQKKTEFPEDHPLQDEYVLVTLIFQTLPGPTIHSTQLHVDGVVVDVATTQKVASTIVSGETLVGTTWTITTKTQEDNVYIGKEIVITREVPGNPIPYTSVEEDGKIKSGIRTLKDTTLITSSETLVGTTWTKTSKEFLTTRLTIGEEASDLVSWEVVESRPIPGNDMVKTVIDADGDIVTETRTMVAGPPTLVTTITTAGGVYTKTFGEPISDLVSWKVVQVKATQATLDSYEAEIPDLLPEEFRPGVPVTTHEETLIGNATAPTLPLALGVLFEKNAQIDFNTYRHTIRGRTGISLPQTITNKEITSEFGGGDCDRVLTLDLYNNLSLDEGLMVLTSNIRKIDDQANGLAVKTSRIVQGSSWPILYGTHVDEKYDLVIGIQRQTVDAGTTGGVLGDGTIVEVRPHDKWKSIQISSKLDTDSLPEDVQWFASMQYSFPPELVDAVIDWAEATCDCADKFAAVLIANMTQYSGIVKTRVTEQFYDGPPPDDVSITQFFPESHNFGFAFASVCGCGEGAVVRALAPEFHIPLCLHDDITLCVGGGALCAGAPYSWPFAATSPAVLPHGDYIMLAPHVERWRFGVFRRVLTEVLVP